MEDTQQQEQVTQTEALTQPQETGQEPQIEEIQVPDNWEPDLKDFITGIKDQAGKKAVFDKINNYEKGYQKKFQDLADERKAYEADKQAFDANKSLFDTYSGFDKSIEPSMRSEIISRYGNIPNYMQALHQMDLMASRQPMDFIKNYCLNNGITAEKFSQFLGGADYTNAYQENISSRSQEALKAEIMKELEEKHKAERLAEEAQRFASAKNDAGELLHPLLSDDSFLQDMDALQTAFPNKTLDELYQMTLNLRPELRQKSIDEEVRKAMELKDLEKAKSAVGVKTQIPTRGSQPKKNWRQTVYEQIDAMED